ncbi:MAG: hypothetical protein JW746_10815, partial [Candidatus Krumholzibacteriota bacterium]|nr:hypothetical protein [Candidatus Krumholzibacteriota bacterium]
MKSRLLSIFLLVFTLVVMTSGELIAQTLKVAPKNPDALSGGDPQFGLIPPPMDLSHIIARPGMDQAAASTWDWRALGGVTSVKNQNPYGTCWCFGCLGNFEASVLINDSVVNDYSEMNIQGCNIFSQNCFTGGNAWIAVNYLALNGTVDEACDPYPGDCPNSSCINYACAFDKQVTEWRLIPNDVASIKAAVQTWGPCYTSMYASFPAFSTYDGTYCMSYTGTEGTNHGVVIVGWDDDMCGGNGAWIIKNSWGTSWGDSGFFYIEYGSARVGTNVNVITGYKDYDPSEKIYSYDEWGWWGSIGYGDGDDFGMIELTPSTASETLTAVSFWAVAAPGTYTVKIYDDFSGSAVSTLLAGPIVKSATEEGYYSVPLPTPLVLTMGDPIYIEVEFSNGYAYPIPMDDTGPMETGKTFTSDDGLSYNSLGPDGDNYGDVGIRGHVAYEVVENDCSFEGDAGIYGLFYASADVVAGETYCDVVGPANFGFISTLCSDVIDTFCMHYYDDYGWPVTTTYAEDAEGACWELDSGYTFDIEVC